MEPEHWMDGQTGGELDNGDAGEPEFWFDGQTGGELFTGGGSPPATPGLTLQIVWF